MLHHNAQTRFLLSRMSRAIQISFSIRQGDPLAMLLYILYIEPLVIYLERHVSGIRFPSFQQSVESYCDDLNVMTEDIRDIEVVDYAVSEFEKVSGGGNLYSEGPIFRGFFVPNYRGVTIENRRAAKRTATRSALLFGYRTNGNSDHRIAPHGRSHYTNNEQR